MEKLVLKQGMFGEWREVNPHYFEEILRGVFNGKRYSKEDLHGFRSYLTNIWLDIANQIKIHHCDININSVIIKPKRDSLKELLAGKDVTIGIPVDKLAGMVAEKYGIPAEWVIIPKVLNVGVDPAVLRLIKRIDDILNSYDDHYAKIEQERRADKERRKVRHSVHKAKERVSSMLSAKEFKVPKSIVIDFKDTSSSRINNHDFYYDCNTSTLHMSYNLSMVMNGTNRYRKEVIGCLESLFLKVPGYAVDENAQVKEIDYWSSLESLDKCREVQDGIIIKKETEYVKTGELNMLSPKGSNEVYVNDVTFTLFVNELIPYKLITTINSTISSIKAFNVDESTLRGEMSSNNFGSIAYGKFRHRKPKVRPPYEDYDVMDEQSIDIDDIVDSYYNFSDLLNEEV